MPLVKCEKVLIFSLIFSMSKPLYQQLFNPSLALGDWLYASVKTAKTCKVTSGQYSQHWQAKSVQIECVSLSLTGALCSS